MGIRHRFRVDGRRYVYDAGSSQVLALPRALYELLPRWERAPRGARAARGSRARLDELSAARRRRLLATAPPALVNPLRHPALAGALARNASALTLGLTEKCNLRCAYCPYTQNDGSWRVHSTRSMSLAMAERALTLFCRSFDQRQAPMISFYGGEPLLEFALLEAVVESAGRVFAPRAVAFSMTTNGTIMNDEIARFLVAHDFRLTVSLDGPKEVHDRYRTSTSGRGSHERVLRSLAVLEGLDPDYVRRKVFINAVLAPPLDVEAMNEYLLTHAPIPWEKWAVSLVDGEGTGFLQRHPYRRRDARHTRALRRRAEDCLVAERSERDPLAMLLFRKPLLRVAFRSPANVSGQPFIPTGQCFPGGHKLFVDASGYLHMCERLGEGCPIGHAETGIRVDAVRAVLGPFFEDALATCDRCYAFRLCGVCVEGTIRGAGYSKPRKAEACAEARRQLHNDLVSYVRIVKRNPGAFTRFAPLEPPKSFAEVLGWSRREIARCALPGN